MGPESFYLSISLRYLAPNQSFMSLNALSPLFLRSCITAMAVNLISSIRFFVACSAMVKQTVSIKTEQSRGKTNNVVSEQVRHNRPVQSQKQARSLKLRI